MQAAAKDWACEMEAAQAMTLHTARPPHQRVDDVLDRHRGGSVPQVGRRVHATPQQQRGGGPGLEADQQAGRPAAPRRKLPHQQDEVEGHNPSEVQAVLWQAAGVELLDERRLQCRVGKREQGADRGAPRAGGHGVLRCGGTQLACS